MKRKRDQKWYGAGALWRRNSWIALAMAGCLGSKKLQALIEEKGAIDKESLKRLFAENRDADPYSGKVASARFFANTVLSLCARKAQAIKRADKVSLDIAEESLRYGAGNTDRKALCPVCIPSLQSDKARGFAALRLVGHFNPLFSPCRFLSLNGSQWAQKTYLSLSIPNH